MMGGLFAGYKQAKKSYKKYKKTQRWWQQMKETLVRRREAQLKRGEHVPGETPWETPWETLKKRF